MTRNVATKSAAPFVILCDTREQRPPPLPSGCVYERATIREGDYSTRALLALARVERKAALDLVGTLTHGRERFEREADRLRPFAFRCIVVEGSAATVSRLGRIHPNALIGSLASLHSRWGLPTIFLESPEAVGRYIAGVFRRLEEELAAGRWAA
jgi:DNA excision repair protein ERCC-4